jgi:CRISPR-associated endonuclease/helicase Cas3
LLTDHLLDVAIRAGAPGESLWLTGLCHDLGKATGFFQDYLHGAKTDPFLKAHALFGAFWLFEALAEGKPTPEEILRATLHALFVRSHHGCLDNLEEAFSLNDIELGRCRQRLAAADLDGIAGWLGAQLGRGPMAAPSFQVKPLRRVPLSRALDRQADPAVAWPRFQTALRDFGRLIRADRDSASRRMPDLSGPKTQFDASHLERFRAAGRFDGATAESSIASARDAVFHVAVAGAATRPSGGHLWTLEVPTGAGKTLAALGWAVARRKAHHAAGRGEGGTIFYALPFTSIIDQTAAVLRRLWPEAAEEPGALAVHHHLADYGAAVGGEDGSLARDWAETWRADVVCTTFVQIVHALFHGTAADARRFAALAGGGLLILDEAQALPAELWPTLRAALLCLTRIFGVDVLLLTATQPTLLHAEDNAIDLRPLGDANLGMDFDRYDVVIEAGPPWDAAALVAATAGALDFATEREHSALLLLNTVNEALAVHDAVRRHPMLGALPIFHLFTNLRPKDRARILEEVRVLEANGLSRLLVATQVVEAGVDLSFNLVFRVHAPLDAIVQAAGRCNRHGSGRRGIVRVFAFIGASGHRVYGAIKMGVAGELLDELAAMFPDQPVPEPAFVARVPEFFRRVRDRLGGALNKARDVTEAVRRLEFAALRGEDFAHDAARTKHVELIAEDASKIPVFIETDPRDEAVWQRLLVAHALSEPRRRRAALRVLRADVGACVVSVPERPAPPMPDATTGLVHIRRADFPSFYDPDTGWKRPLPV